MTFQELSSYDPGNAFEQHCAQIDSNFFGGVTGKNCNYTMALEFTGDLGALSDPLPPGDEPSVAGVPEPRALSLFGIGLVSLLFARRRSTRVTIDH